MLLLQPTPGYLDITILFWFSVTNTSLTAQIQILVTHTVCNEWRKQPVGSFKYSSNFPMSDNLFTLSCNDNVSITQNVYVVHRHAYNNIIKALQTDRSCSELRTVTKDNTELAVHGVQWSVWSPCLWMNITGKSSSNITLEQFILQMQINSPKLFW